MSRLYLLPFFALCDRPPLREDPLVPREVVRLRGEAAFFPFAPRLPRRVPEAREDRAVRAASGRAA